MILRLRRRFPCVRCKRIWENSDCVTLREKVDTLSTFTSSEPYPDPRIFSFFPNLQTIEVPVEPVFYKYCSKDVSGTPKRSVHHKTHRHATECRCQKQAFITDLHHLWRCGCNLSSLKDKDGKLHPVKPFGMLSP